MQKIQFLILIVLSLFIAWLSTTVWQLKQNQMELLAKNIELQNQRINRLNDEWIAIQKSNPPSSLTTINMSSINSTQRNIKNTTPENLTATTQKTTIYHQNIVPFYTAKEAIQDRLRIAQVLLQEQQLSKTLEQLQVIHQQFTASNITSLDINTNIKAALIEALNKDQQTILNYSQQRTQQLQQLQQQLSQINQILEHTKPMAQLNTQSQIWQWNNWLSIRKSQTIPDWQNRQLLLKQIQLQLLLAQQALLAGQMEFYRQQLEESQHLIADYPDQAVQNVKQILQHLNQQPMLIPPTLTAYALLETNKNK